MTEQPTREPQFNFFSIDNLSRGAVDYAVYSFYAKAITSGSNRFTTVEKGLGLDKFNMTYVLEAMPDKMYEDVVGQIYHLIFNEYGEIEKIEKELLELADFNTIRLNGIKLSPSSKDVIYAEDIIDGFNERMTNWLNK